MHISGTTLGLNQANQGPTRWTLFAPGQMSIKRREIRHKRLAAAGWAMVRNQFTWDIAMDGYRKLLGL